MPCLTSDAPFEICASRLDRLITLSSLSAPWSFDILHILPTLRKKKKKKRIFPFGLGHHHDGPVKSLRALLAPQKGGGGKGGRRRRRRRSFLLTLNSSKGRTYTGLPTTSSASFTCSVTGRWSFFFFFFWRLA